MIARYTVIGQPVAHSLSPGIHNLFGELAQRRIHYSRTEATADNFEQTVLDWQSSGAQGCNITLPFKQQALAVCQRLTPAARQAGAVNTILMHRDGQRVGHNTDGSGLCTDIERNLRFSLAGQHLLILGAGGAARGALGPLLDRGPRSVVIVNRTASRAIDLAADFSDHADAAGCTLSGCGYETMDGSATYGLIINATSLSLAGELPPLPERPFSHAALSYDMMYARGDTVFMRWSREAGASQISDGFGMLVEQAADAFLMWEGVRPKVRMASARLRALREGK